MARNILAIGEGGVCRSSPGLARSALRIIDRSVGAGGVNDPADVREVQRRLNQADPATARPTPPLAVDGICGPKTRAAILNFQTLRGLPVKDGRIDPNGPTANLLRDGAAADPTENEAFLRAMADDLPAIREWLSQADRAIGFAAMSLSGGGGLFAESQAKAFRLLDKYFHVSKVAPADQLTFIADVQKVYRDMQVVVSQARLVMGQNGWGAGYFQPDPNDGTAASSPYVAYTYPGGWNAASPDGAPRMSNDDNFVGPNLREDGIYFPVSKFRVRSVNFRRRIVIHEMAHFVGPASGAEAIVDKSYIRDPRFFSLSPIEAKHCADVYACYVAELATGANPLFA